MLDPRIYRAALVPVLLALLVVAFSLADRPRPVTSTLAPDPFDADGAMVTLDQMADAYPNRRPGGTDDERLAQVVAARLKTALGSTSEVRTENYTGRTIDGKQDLENVVGLRPGRPGPQIVVVAHRDAAQRGSKAELSGTAAMLELARVVGDGSLNRTITFVSTSGGSGGLSGAVEAAKELGGQSVDAVLVLGDVAGTTLRKPWVVPYVNGAGLAPLQLRRSVESALRTETLQDPGGPRAVTQIVRQAARVTPSEQGAFGEQGLPAVLMQVSGERGPSAGEPVDRDIMNVFGRAALRTIFALDEGARVTTQPSGYVVTKKKVLPGWAIRLLCGALLLPVWLATLDGFARARRRRSDVGPWLVWVLATALPFALAAAMAVVLGLTGLIDPAPPALLRPDDVDVDGAALTALGVVLLTGVLAFLVVRPLFVRVAGPPHAPRASPLLRETSSGAGPAAAVALVISALSFVTWLINPYLAFVLVPAAHLWLLVVAPEIGLPRPAAVMMVLLGLVAPLLLAFGLASIFHTGLGTGTWLTVVAVAGGALGPLSWLGWAVACGCALCALLVALRPVRREELTKDEVTSRGPLSYAGPGSLGGTPSSTPRR